MSAAKLTMPLDPARTDADWVTDITFFVDNATTPEDWTGCDASLALVPRSAVIRGSASFLLSSDSGGGLVVLSNGVGIRVDAEAMAGRTAATYDFELRKHDGAAIEAVLVGSVVIEQGLSEIAAGEVVTGALAISGGIGGVKVVRSDAGFRVIRAGGAQGDPGPDQAVLIQYDDANTDMGVTDVQQAVEVLSLTKADANAVVQSLALKANTADVSIALAEKLDATAGAIKTAGGALKAEISFVTPQMFGADGVDDTAATLAFLAWCDTHGVPGHIGDLNIGPVSYTATNNLRLTCKGKITNRSGVAATAALLRLSGSGANKISWSGGVFDGASTPHSLLHLDNWLQADVYVDRASGILATPSSSNSTSAILLDGVIHPSLRFGVLSDMSKGTNTQGSVPRGVTIQSAIKASASVSGGLIRDGHGAFVIGNMGGGTVDINGVSINTMADNGVYNVGDAAAVNVNNCDIYAAEEPLVNSGTGFINMTGGSAIACTNAVGLQNCGGIRLTGVHMEPVAGQNLIRTRTGNTLSGALEVRDCKMVCRPTFEAVYLGIGALTSFVDVGNEWIIYYDSAVSTTDEIFEWDTGDWFYSEGSRWVLRDATANIPNGPRYFSPPAAVTKLSHWHSRLVNETANSSAYIRMVNMRQQLITFSNLFSVNNINAETEENYGALVAAPPRVVWGIAAPIIGYWPQGSVVHNTTPTKWGPTCWVCTAGGSPGTWVDAATAFQALSGAKTQDWGTVAAGASATTDVTVTGATLGDMVIGVSFGADLTNGAFLVGRVTATNNVRVTLFNPSAVSVTPGSASLRVRVARI